MASHTPIGRPVQVCAPSLQIGTIAPWVVLDFSWRSAMMGIPDWLAPAVFGASIALVGFVGKQFIEWITELRRRDAAKASRLVELHSLLRAMRTAFLVQKDLANRLIGEVAPASLGNAIGREAKLVAAYPSLTPAQQDLHDIIRSITVATMHSLNTALLSWLRSDLDFKWRVNAAGVDGDLARHLIELESHLLLWLAKYEVWIPNHPEHALVYLADEQRHGLGFPVGLDALVERKVSAAGRSMFGFRARPRVTSPAGKDDGP